MPVTSDMSIFGDLTGSGVDTVHTAAGTEYVSGTFVNHDSVARTLSIYINGTGATNRVLNAVTLETQESMVIEIKLGSGDTLRAAASAASAICAFIEVDALS